ncbi:MATE family efflux transporter [Clostridium sp. MCC353]|uniref:MATE family efflux transporter n=1 Tax=Clostridium sp. MCC353 TaxID=2592646 RepID=UPI00207A9C8A|nr:MATE family efflux transporter [Clostridium sp. MCC353]
MMNTELQKQKFRHMTEDPVEKLVCSMAVPSIISMLVSAFYNMADTFFVGKVSTQATAAIGVVFPYMALIQAVSFFFGHGSGNYISRALGRQETKDAEKMAANGFFSALIFGLLLLTPCFLLMNPLLTGLGATDTILPDARSYFKYILLATPFMMCSLVMNNQMRLQGNARKAMVGISTGAILNIILDPLLIFGLKMGVSGAALATAVSQFTSFLILLHMSGQGDGVKIHWKAFSPSVRAYREIIAGGLPSLCRQGLASIATICLNQAAGFYGDSAIAAFSVVNRITIISSSALLGFGQGFQPVCGFNYGAKLYERVKKAFWFCIRVSTVAMSTLGIFGFIFAESIVRLFRANDPELIRIGAQALRYQSLVFPFLGWVTITNMYLQTTRKTVRASVLSMSRQGIVFIPVLFTAIHFLALKGIQMTQPISDILTFCIAVPFGLSALHEVKEEGKS